MTKIEGLSAELRKAVKCMQTHYPADKKAHSGDCVYWLPAVLAGKEMQRIRKELLERLAMEDTYVPNFGIDLDKVKEIVDSVLKGEKVEGVFG